jgi:hypothetical protein
MWRRLFKRFDIFYFITLIFLLLSAKASLLSANNWVWLGTLLLMGLVGVLKKSFTGKEIKKLVSFTAGFLAFVIVRDMLIEGLSQEFLVADIIFLFKYIYLGALLCAILKHKTAGYIVRVMADLAVVSLLCYIAQLFAGKAMYQMFKSIDIPHLLEPKDYSNAIFFTYYADTHRLANSGFVFEPGAYGCFLVIALLLHLFLNQFKFDNTAMFLIITVLTTFSTTGYLGLFATLILALRCRSKITAWGLVLLPICLFAFIFVPFLGDKIKKTMNQDRRDLKHIYALNKKFNRIHEQVPLGRFSSALYVYRGLGQDLIWGVGSKYDQLLNVSYDVNVSNGIFELMAQFGLLGLLYLIYNYLRFCYYHVKKWKYLTHCLVIAFCLGFGQPVLAVPLVLMFMFIPARQIKLNIFELPEVDMPPNIAIA